MDNNISNEKKEEFSKIRSVLWPIHDYELKKILPLFFIFFCISFVYTILRDTKDTLVMTAPGAGAEVVPFLKLWCVVPAAVILMLLYSKLSNIVSKENLFYVTIIPFLVFFLAFAFYLYPNCESIHPIESSKWLRSVLPNSAAFKGIIGIYRNWLFALFYTLSEMWGSMIITTLFWGFANDINGVEEAKRFYGILGIGANAALVFSGRAIRWAASGGFGEGFDVALQALTLFIAVAGILILITYYWMNKVVLIDPKFYDPTQMKKRKTKPKLNMKESIVFLMKSKYLACIATMVMSYGITINLIEVTWKDQLKQQYPEPNAYQFFMGYFSEITGITTMCMFFFVSHNVIRRCGWKTAALVTPTVLLLTGLAFLSFIVFRGNLSGIIASFGTTPLFMAVVFGAAQNILSKSSKYSLFDPTKEMSYIPLDVESKVKGKAAIDVVAPSLGKSGGSVIQQCMMFFLPTITAMAPYIMIMFTIILSSWFYAITILSKKFKEASEAEQKIEKE